MPKPHHVIIAGAAVGTIALVAAVAPDPAPKKRKRKPEKKGKRRRPRRGRITTSTLDKRKTVRESPRKLLAQARKRFDPDITLDEMTAARLIVSELASGNVREMAAMVDAELNRAKSKGKTLTEHLTSTGTYGKQGGKHGRGKKRPASNAVDPSPKHVRIARAVMSGELRGIAKGAVRFLDPDSQMSQHRKWLAGKTDRRHCHPATVLERWSFDKAWNKRGPECSLHDKPGRHLEEWVGPIDGIDPMRVMLMRPAKPGEEHERRYQEARRLILERYPLPKSGEDNANRQP